MISFTLIALLLAVLGIALGDPSLSSIAMINVLLGALIGFPLMFVGKARVKRASRLLSGAQHQIGYRAANSLQQTNELMTTGLDQDAQRILVQ